MAITDVINAAGLEKLVSKLEVVGYANAGETFAQALARKVNVAPQHKYDPDGSTPATAPANYTFETLARDVLIENRILMDGPGTYEVPAEIVNNVAKIYEQKTGLQIAPGDVEYIKNLIAKEKSTAD